MKYDRKFQSPRQSGYDASTNDTGENMCGIF